MVLTLIIAAATSLLLILSILFFPRIRIRKVSFGSYWVIALIGAGLMLATGRVSFRSVIDGLTSDSSINPFKILCLFISMTILSIFLDEVGFFKHMANVVCRKAGKSQTRLFIYLYVLTSVLTVFTSNDIIILTFTPFICYFTRCAGIDPQKSIPCLIWSGNSWSQTPGA